MISASLSAWLLVGCAPALQADFTERQRQALATPDAPPSNWKPDGAVRLGRRAIEGFAARGVARALRDMEPVEFGGAAIQPDFLVRQVRVQDAGCDECVGLGMVLKGSATVADVDWVDLTITLVADLSIDAEPGDEGVQLWLNIVDLRRLEVESEGLGGMDFAEWLQDELPRFDLGRVGGDGLPILAMRVRGIPEGLSADFLTATIDPGIADVSRSFRTPREFEILVSEQTLLHRARANMMAQGPGRMDIVPEPTGLHVEGGSFTLDVRLWRIQGRAGWWRDYEVEGWIRVVDGELSLIPRTVELVDKSPRARLADPLAVIANVGMLRAIEEAVSKGIPVWRDVDDGAVRFTITEARGVRDMLSLTGKAEEQ